MKKYQKRGQVAIFAAIAVILIIVFGIIFYVFVPDQASRGDLLVDDVSAEFSPIQEYVHSCIEQVGEDAVSILGLRGGYLFDGVYRVPGFYNLYPSQLNPTEANSFYFMAGSDIVVPYWFYQSNTNGAGVATFDSEIPKLESEYSNGIERLQNRDMSIEAQIDSYVNLNLDRCLSGFEVFEQEGFNVSSQVNLPTATTYVVNDGVQIQIYYPLEVTSDDSVQRMENFGVIVPVRLKQMYDLASFITKMEVENNFLERNTINLLIMNSMVDSKYFPPINDFAFEAGPGNSWRVSDVKENVRQLLYFTKMLQVQGAQNYRQVELENVDYAFRARQKTYDNMILPIVDLYSEELIEMESILPEVDIDFEYLDYPIYFNVNADGNEIKPDVYGLDFGSFSFGFQQYDTRYDISWPVLITMRDYTAFNGEGFTFNFGLEGNVRQNSPMNTTQFKDRLTIPGDRFPSICSPEQLTSNITVRVTDQNLEPLEEVSVTLRIDGQNCVIGITNDNGTFVGGVPTGVLNGELVATKNGYLDEKMYFVPDADEYEFNGMLELKEMNFTVKKVTLTGSENGLVVSGISDLDGEEEAIVSLDRYSANEEEGGYGITFIIDNETSTFQGDFVEGIYDISIILFDNGEVINISDTEVNGQVIAGLQRHGMITGGVEMKYTDNYDLSVAFDSGLVASNSEIVLYTLEFDVDWSDYNNFALVGEVEDYSVRFADRLVPELNE